MIRVKLNIAKIKMLLAERALSAAAFADKCGVSRSNFSTIIRRGTCRPATAGKLARGLGVPVKDIILEEV